MLMADAPVEIVFENYQRIHLAFLHGAQRIIQVFAAHQAQAHAVAFGQGVTQAGRAACGRERTGCTGSGLDHLGAAQAGPREDQRNVSLSQCPGNRLGQRALVIAQVINRGRGSIYFVRDGKPQPGDILRRGVIGSGGDFVQARRGGVAINNGPLSF